MYRLLTIAGLQAFSWRHLISGIQPNLLHFSPYRPVPSSPATVKSRKEHPTWLSTDGWAEVWKDRTCTRASLISFWMAATVLWILTSTQPPTTTPLTPQDVGHIAAWDFRVTNLVLPLGLKWCSSPTHPGQFTYPSGQKSTTLTITSWGNLAPAFLTWLNFKLIL